MSTKKYKWKGESRTARKGLDRVWFIFRVIATHLTFSFQLYDDKSRVITSKITMPHMLPYWLPTKEESECMHKAGGLSWLSEIYPPSYHQQLFILDPPTISLSKNANTCNMQNTKKCKKYKYKYTQRKRLSSRAELSPEALPQISVWQKKKRLHWNGGENENIRLARSGFEQLRFICRVITRAPITLSLPPISSISLSKKEKGFPTKVQRRKRKITHVVHTNNRHWLSENAC